MKKEEQLAQIKAFRDGLKAYLGVCQLYWQAVNRDYTRPTETVIKQEEELRETLTEQFGSLEVLFKRLGVPTQAVVPAIGIPYSVFDEALSADFERRIKGESLEGAISAATKAIGLFSALPESDYRGFQRATPILFIGHSFADRHKEPIGAIKEFCATFPISVTTGEKPSTDEVSSKVKELIDDSDFVMAILTQDKEGADGKMYPSKWVSDEIAYAMGKGKKVIRLLEEGAQYESALSADAEYIRFERENLSPAYIKLAQVLNGLLGN